MKNNNKMKENVILKPDFSNNIIIGVHLINYITCAKLHTYIFNYMTSYGFLEASLASCFWAFI